jgi:hypothetical protein
MLYRRRLVVCLLCPKLRLLHRAQLRTVGLCRDVESNESANGGVYYCLYVRGVALHVVCHD